MLNLIRAVLDHRVGDRSVMATDDPAFRADLSRVEQAARTDFGAALFLGEICAQLGDRPKALHWLRHAVELGCTMPDYINRYSPFLANLRDDPEFQAIVENAQRGAIRMRTLIDRTLAEIQ